ncbi:MAG: SIR2 family protein [Ginsengibacter sp.]
MEEIQKILEDINNNKCILFIGPLMTTLKNKGKRKSLTEIYCEHILENFKEDAIIFDDAAKRNPYFLTTKYISRINGRANFEKELKQNFDSLYNRSSSIYFLLSKLPFNTIINFGADRMMQNALGRNGFEFSDEYYDYNGKYQQYIEGLDSNLQLVYNLLGSVKYPQSQVLTEDDHLQFVKRVVSGPKLPDNVLSRIKDDQGESKSYLFLGFNFEEWPFRFLLDVLQLPKAKNSATPKLPGYNIGLMTQEFYKEKFGLKFINEDPEEFAKTLINEYFKIYKQDKHSKGFIIYHDYDKSTLEEFNEYLERSKLRKRIEFWWADKILPGDVKSEDVMKHFDEATIYIPLISNKFLNDPGLSNQLKQALKKSGALIFPIIVSSCDYETDFPELGYKSALILPGNDKTLITAMATPSAEDYLLMIKKINSKIR